MNSQFSHNEGKCTGSIGGVFSLVCRVLHELKNISQEEHCRHFELAVQDFYHKGSVNVVHDSLCCLNIFRFLHGFCWSIGQRHHSLSEFQHGIENCFSELL